MTNVNSPRIYYFDTDKRSVFAHLFIVLVTVAAGPIYADDDPRPSGALFRTLFGDTLEQKHNIALLGYAQITAAKSNHHIEKTRLPQGRGRGVQPQGGLIQDEGLNLQHVGLILCKGSACPPGHVFEPNRNVLSRVTPLPGPRGEEIIIDWAVTAHYGEDALFWSTKGFDDWKWDARK